jgi:hypothetical protein
VEQPAEPVASTQLDAPVDLTRLERIEGELQAVEQALEQIDQGIYEGFTGLESSDPAGSARHGPGRGDAVPEV